MYIVYSAARHGCGSTAFHVNVKAGIPRQGGWPRDELLRHNTAHPPRNGKNIEF